MAISKDIQDRYGVWHYGAYGRICDITISYRRRGVVDPDYNADVFVEWYHDEQALLDGYEPVLTEGIMITAVQNRDISGFTTLREFAYNALKETPKFSDVIDLL